MKPEINEKINEINENDEINNEQREILAEPVDCINDAAGERYCPNEPAPYYIGVDIGSNSVGYAVTDEEYKPCKFRGEPMLGVTLFDDASEPVNRRAARSTRRRLARRRLRIDLINELFAEEITKVDPTFFVRRRESFLNAADRSDEVNCGTHWEYERIEQDGRGVRRGVSGDKTGNGENEKPFPTIHHLIMRLMKSAKGLDVRHVYFAIAWLVAHRGHFLYDIDANNAEALSDIGAVYDELWQWCTDNGCTLRENKCDAAELDELRRLISEEKSGKSAKNALSMLLFGISYDDAKVMATKADVDDEYQLPFVRAKIVDLLLGKEVKVSSLVADADAAEDDNEDDGEEKISFKNGDGLEDRLPQLCDNAEMLCILLKMYNLVKLGSLFAEEDYAIRSEDGKKKRPECISELKVGQYEAHRRDLAELKQLLKSYASADTLRAEKLYFNMFRYTPVKKDTPVNKDKKANKKSADEANYSSYVGSFKCFGDGVERKKESRENFYKYVERTLRQVEKAMEGAEENDTSRKNRERIANIREKIAKGTYMPKQVSGENRCIPHQLYEIELSKMLENAEKCFQFLGQRDADGLSVSDKIKSVFKFRIPYYVGPLVDSSKSKNAWLVRKAEGRILPWNFDKMVDGDACEMAFISRMTNKCTYLPGENVLPRESLLYSKFIILNTINCITINGEPLSVEEKKRMFADLFEGNGGAKKKKCADIQGYLIANGLLREDEKNALGGLADDVEMSYGVYHVFKEPLQSNVITFAEAEEIIERGTCTADRRRFGRWLRAWCEENNKQLSEKQIGRILGHTYKEFGSLSGELLDGISCTDKANGEHGTVMHFLWNTNKVLNQIIADKDAYTFSEKIAKLRLEYYAADSRSNDPKDINSRLEQMRVASAVRRPIIRTLDIVADIVKAKKYPPKAIFVEMARDTAEEKRNNKKNSNKNKSIARKDQLRAAYTVCNELSLYADEVEQLGSELDREANMSLRRKQLFLYYSQLGRCMYCGKSIVDMETANVDHILPRSLVKDDSLDNTVLVCSTENGAKGDRYPVDPEWQKKMGEFWKRLNKVKLISNEKYRRLTRKTELSNDEVLGFINRQLVETRQASKVVVSLLGEKYKGARICCVKAGDVSDLRNRYGSIKDEALHLGLDDEQKKLAALVKCRSTDDIHHAYDAYLNIVVGNIYRKKFNSDFIKKIKNLKRDGSKDPRSASNYGYNIRIEKMFAQQTNDAAKRYRYIENIDKTMRNRNVHLTKYQQHESGCFYKVTRCPAVDNKNGSLIPFKSVGEREFGRAVNLDPSRYGGYNSASTAFFVLAGYEKGKKRELTFVPVVVQKAERFRNDSEFAVEYLRNYLGDKVKNISLPLGDRVLRINTMLSLDGFDVCLSGKGGNQLLVRSMMTPRYTDEWVRYIKKIENTGKMADEAKKANQEYSIGNSFDGIDKDKNLALFDYLTEMMRGKVYSKMPASAISICARRDDFAARDLTAQTELLEGMILYLKSNRAGACDMDRGTALGSKNEGIVRISANLSAWKKNYKEVRIIDRSPSGLFEWRSENLLDLLEGEKG